MESLITKEPSKQSLDEQVMHRQIELALEPINIPVINLPSSGHGAKHINDGKIFTDTEIKEFSELTDYYRVKKTGRQVNVKSNLYTMASNHYWMRVRAHSKDDRATALPAKWLLEQLSHDYRRLVRILFYVSDEWEFKKST